LDRIRQAYRDALERRGQTDDTSCPDPEALLSLAEGAGPEAERLEVLDHVMSCSTCRQEFELLRALAVARPRERNWLRSWMAAAASVVLLAGAGYAVWWQMGPGDTVYRGADSGVELVAPESGGSVDGDVQFVWRGESGAFEYVLEILDPDGGSLLRRTTADTLVIVHLPDHPGLSGSVRWWVRARLDDGTEKVSETRPLNLPRG
jgi:hypothetical protein